MKRVHPAEPILRRPRLIRSFNMVAEEFPKPLLVRQTNEHECLPHELWVKWWAADAEEKNNIWLEYEATTW